jgi:septum formation protein
MLLVSDNLKGRKVVLASGSPRRKELLASIVEQFTVRVPQVDETFPASLRGKEIAEYLAALKAEAAQVDLQENEIAITSDTIVWLGDEVLNKPKDAAEAAEMLRKLSGRTHEVITAIALADQHRKIILSDTTEVRFKTLTQNEIQYYIEHYKPFDKAGAYGIQEWIGYVGVTEIKGSFYTVMGLPVHLLYNALLGF